MNPYEKIGLPKIINGAGKMTYLGSSAIEPDVIEKIGMVAQGYVDMELLKPKIGKLAGRLAGAEAGCVTACSAAGIVISVASVLTGGDIYKVEMLPDVNWMPNEIIIQKGHMVNFGANIAQAIRLTGAAVKEIGMVTGTKEYHLLGAINERTAAIMYVVSHHAVSNGMLSLEQVIKIAHEHNLQVIVDAAAETDLSYYAGSGADYVIFSGHKAIGGPTSGLIIGSEERMHNCQIQDKGIARMMKVGKENIMGLYFALEQYSKRNEEKQVAEFEKIAEELQRLLADIKGVTTKIKWDATRPIPRVQLILGKNCKLTGKQMISELEGGNPSIRTRNHLVDEGIIQFDPRELKADELPVIAKRIFDILA